MDRGKQIPLSDHPLQVVLALITAFVSPAIRGERGPEV
ncbi:hypothetical protein Mesil_1844 [Allomeiothermus silvanus DSM 9946]|uniref:Uncharacterized protein n=1 Tax=Allomeiothermus silvanus (strain ATCC 700542 / DSM 9946 / NBRC 106475 / NCIMB 13440 / VI-R2) TaxID=526227 RepID=D7BG18_ALLS1|nr:hypothetical protein Mesil_1844 [Allomeiothermus silvanus DSM 9946]